MMAIIRTSAAPAAAYHIQSIEDRMDTGEVGEEAGCDKGVETTVVGEGVVSAGGEVA